MAKSTNNAGNAKRATTAKILKTATAATATTKAKPAAKSTSTTAQRRTTKTGTAAKGAIQKKQGAPARARRRRLSPIAERETEAQILAAAAAETGIEERVGTLFNAAVMNRVTRHVMKGGSGNAPIPNLGASLVRGEQSARTARTMFSSLLKREVNVPAKRAQAVPRLRAHPTLRDIVARA